jgi:hypothetical protein
METRYGFYRGRLFSPAISNGKSVPGGRLSAVSLLQSAKDLRILNDCCQIKNRPVENVSAHGYNDPGLID